MDGVLWLIGFALVIFVFAVIVLRRWRREVNSGGDGGFYAADSRRRDDDHDGDGDGGGDGGGGD